MASLSPALEEREEELRQTLDNLERPEELASVCTGTQAQRIVQNLRALLGEFKAALLADEGQGQVQGQTDAGDATTTQRRLQRHAALRVRIHSLNGRYQGRLNEVRQAERRSLLAAASDLPAASGGSVSSSNADDVCTMKTVVAGNDTELSSTWLSPMHAIANRMPPPVKCLQHVHHH